MNQYDVIVVGAGAAGMLAAGRAAEKGARVLLLEKMERAGRKLLITGKGRCNITNDAPVDEFFEHIFPHPRFLKNAFSQFSPTSLLELLSDLGLSTITERGGRIFPASGRAADVVATLMKYLQNSRIRIEYQHKAIALLHDGNQVQGVRCLNMDKKVEYQAPSVILCTGGKSYPATGSTGDGYALAASVGHSIIQPLPALVPLETGESIPEKLSGLLLKNVQVSLWIDGKKAGEEFGEMSFESFGLDGAVILTLSRLAVVALENKSKVEVSIDLKPALTEEKLDFRLQRDLAEEGKKNLHNLFKSWLPMQLTPYFLQLASLDANKPGHQVNGKERKKILHLMKDLRFEIKGHRSFREAIVTSGGIETGEVSSQTMESKKVKGLYFAGELLNLDANTGGFNLQIAFSTGWLAGEAAANSLADLHPHQ